MNPNNSSSIHKSINIKGKIIATPGHTDDHINLVLKSGETFTGDLFAEYLLTVQDSQHKQS